MNRTAIKTAAALALSLAMHVSAAAILVPPQATMQIAGGAATSQLFIGTAFEDSLMAGDPGEELKPVDRPPVEALAVTPSDTAPAEPVEPLAAAPVSEPALQPVSPDQAMVVEATPALASVPAPSPPSEILTHAAIVESAPARSEELAALAPVDAVEPVAEPEPQAALPETIPVPLPRPEPPRAAAATAKPSTPAPQKPKVAQTRPEKTPEKKQTDRDVQRTASKTSAAGDGGKQRETASKSASGTASAKRTTAAGNAAVSNYPGKVASKLRRSLQYPREAKRQGLRGEVVVSFVVASNGGVSNVRVARSSGSPVLDGAAADAVHRAAPFPKIPADAGRSSWAFSVPLGFTR